MPKMVTKLVVDWFINYILVFPTICIMYNTKKYISNSQIYQYYNFILSKNELIYRATIIFLSCNNFFDIEQKSFVIEQKFI